ncbi:MAG: tRNA (adenosine(37)-N6)-threonylcarbamoyltransferase complex dimerization subunit type 1 TsaB [Acidobacteria bacterium]|nr:tRNA (adenosine(37)-N6)-threonylcarbamoyltransferase complex dimerization subunit type 1 TsaB [Acidobacteriota bacterium]
MPNKTPLILSIETATRAGSIAISRGERLLSVLGGDSSISQSTRLLQQVREALDEAGVTLEEVDIFAASVGPGSFTGLRIGLATVKSFAATLGRLCVGVPTLYAVAQAAGESKRTLALLPAGRGEVFAQMLAVERGGIVHPLDTPIHITPRKLLEKVKSETNLLWAGEGVHLQKEAIEAQALIEGILFRDGSLNAHNEQTVNRQWSLAGSPEVLATAIGKLALLNFRAGEAVPPESLQAIYVRPSDAELNK